MLDRKFNMIAMRRDLRVVAIFSAVSMLLILSACGIWPGTQSASSELYFIATAQTSAPCEACAQATLAVAQTQEKINSDNQAAATALIVRANAEATLNSANATLKAAQTQDQNNANVVAAQIAATAEIVRANAQATLSSAGSTQSAALTQQQYDLLVKQAAGTQSAEALAIQQNKNDLAASTQTAIANNIATQTQSAAATSQWYTDQARQREEQRQAPLAFLWMWCLPIFIVLSGGLVVWGFWRWLRIQQANQRILEKPIEKLQAPLVEVIDHQPYDSLPYLESNVDDNLYQPTKPDDQVRRWLDEVKRKLLSSNKKDQDDNTDS